MYELPPEADLQFLTGATLVQVCTGSNETILHLHDGISITIETDVILFEPTGQRIVFESPAKAATPLAGLLSQTVTRTRRLSSKALELTFGNAARVCLEDTSGHFESFQIKYNGGLVVI